MASAVPNLDSQPTSSEKPNYQQNHAFRIPSAINNPRDKTEKIQHDSNLEPLIKAAA